MTTSSPILRGLDAKKQVVGAITKTQFTACICTNICHFYEQTAGNGRFLLRNWVILGPHKQVKLPSYLEGAECGEAGCRRTEITKT